MTPARAALTALLQGVPDIGVVHAYERYASDVATLKQLYYSAPHQQIRGWFVRRVRVRETGILQPEFLEVTEWQLRGFIGLDDAGQTELVADALIEAVRDRVRANPTLNGTVSQIGLLRTGTDRGLQLEDFGPVLFGGVLCHGIRFGLTTTTQRRQTGSSSSSES